MAIYTSSYSIASTSTEQYFTIGSFDPTDAGLASILNTSTTTINAGTGLPRTTEEYENIAAFWASNTSPGNAVETMNAYGVSIGDVAFATGIAAPTVTSFLISDLYWNIESKSSDDFNIIKDTLTPVGPVEAAVFGRYQEGPSSWNFAANQPDIFARFRVSAPYASKSYTLGIRIVRLVGAAYIPTGVTFTVTFNKSYTLLTLDPTAWVVVSSSPYSAGSNIPLSGPTTVYPAVHHKTYTSIDGFVVGPGGPSYDSSTYPFRWKIPGGSTFAYAGDSIIPDVSLEITPQSSNPFTYEVWTSDELTLLGTYTNYFSGSGSSVTPGSGLNITRDASELLVYPTNSAVNFRPGFGVNGTVPYTYYVTGTLPVGLSLNSSTGYISGTPTVLTSASTYTFTVVDNNNATAQLTFNLTIGTPVASYLISRSTSTVNEGGTVQFNVSTVSVSSGTTLYWTITGTNITGSDFTDTVGGPTTGLTGSVIINNNTASFTKKVGQDITLEGVESFTVQLRTTSVSGPVVATSLPITILDTSTSPADTAGVTANGAIYHLKSVDGSFVYSSSGTFYKVTGTPINLS